MEQQVLKFLQVKMPRNYIQTAQQPFYVRNPALSKQLPQFRKMLKTFTLKHSRSTKKEKQLRKLQKMQLKKQ